MMREERVFFMAGNVKIEGLYGASGGERGVVITHPHPQMGGSMNNNVVEALVEGHSSKGFSTLRFNFRGVGRSGGFYDNGDGEQDDVMGAVAFLQEQKKSEVMLAGYSFGAWIIANVLTHQDQFADVVLVSPPIDFVEFDFSGLEKRIGLIICGDQDQFCPLEKLKGIVSGIRCQLSVVPGADHFYWGREGGILEHIEQYLTK
ncbi:MAG: alpha/beta hydrolase [Deltaproteobacteria bacterium]|nr:alpha/beta hydrolase [Deltaproteobacteria bacterium]